MLAGRCKKQVHLYAMAILLFAVLAFLVMRFALPRFKLASNLRLATLAISCALTGWLLFSLVINVALRAQ